MNKSKVQKKLTENQRNRVTMIKDWVDEYQNDGLELAEIIKYLEKWKTFNPMHVQDMQNKAKNISKFAEYIGSLIRTYLPKE